MSELMDVHLKAMDKALKNDDFTTKARDRNNGEAITLRTKELENGNIEVRAAFVPGTGDAPQDVIIIAVIENGKVKRLQTPAKRVPSTGGL